MASLLPRLAAVPVVGLVLGVVVGGVLGRLAMLLLAALNPDASGRVSDDGFVMGRFTLSGSLSLVAVGAFLGLLGGVIYVAVRWLLFGPGWFRVACVALGAGVPVGNQVVHVDGVDFVLLRPLWLAVGLFVAVPALYGALLTVLVEGRLLRAWPVPAPASPSVGAVLWAGRAAAFAVGVASLVDLVDKVRVLA